jgi:hypothetical protein
MNKAFVREPDAPDRAYCPRCGQLGLPVGPAALDRYVAPESRGKLLDAAWFCSFPHCDAAYFNDLGAVVEVGQLTRPVYPKDLDAPLCACFGLTYDDVAADVRDEQPTRVRALAARAKSAEARCGELAADGRCCLTVVQELYFRLQKQAGEQAQ